MLRIVGIGDGARVGWVCVAKSILEIGVGRLKDDGGGGELEV